MLFEIESILMKYLSGKEKINFLNITKKSHIYLRYSCVLFVIYC